jgi:hypothetical protein
MPAVERFTLENPQVKAILCDVWRSSKKSYYRIDPETGRHVVANLKKELVAIGVKWKISFCPLTVWSLPVSPFLHVRAPQRRKIIPVRELETEIDVDTVEVYELVVENPPAVIPVPVSLPEPEITPPKKKTGPKPIPARPMTQAEINNHVLVLADSDVCGVGLDHVGYPAKAL